MKKQSRGVGLWRFVPCFAFGMLAEGYVMDASNGTLLWQAVDRRGGTTSMAENTLNSWLDVDHAFQSWSEQLASRHSNNSAPATKGSGRD